MTTPAEASRGMCDGGTGWDGDRLAHNPEVEGSNPAPATSFRRSRPFPSRERAFCVPSAVVKRVVATAPRGAWQRDGGDGVTRDETAWTWWTLPPAISGCPARRYPRCPPISSRSCRTSRNARSRGGVRPGPSDVCRVMRLSGARGAALAQVRRRRRGNRGADGGRFVPRALRTSQRTRRGLRRWRAHIPDDKGAVAHRPAPS